MSQKKVLIPGIGEVILAKRRGATHLRLSVTAKGTVRVGLPYWTPYAVGIAFAKDRADWVAKQLAKHTTSDFKDGDQIGKAHRLQILHNPSLKSPTSRLTRTEIRVSSPHTSDHPATQAKVIAAANKALKQEAETLLPQRLAQLATQHGYNYSSVRVRSLTSRWGSCSTKKVITLSYFLVQLPWNLVDYVLLHELVHTKHMNHGPNFWNELESALPGAKSLRKQVNMHKPRASANGSVIE